MAITNTIISGIVWEWQRKDGGFSPFPPHESASIEEAYTAKCRTYSLSGSTQIDLKRTKMRGPRGEHTIQRTPIILPIHPPIQAYWSWHMGGGDNFALYSIEALIEIEQAYMKFPHSSLDLSNTPCRLPYTIDFRTSLQTRQGYGTKRVLKRTLIPNGKSLQFLLQLNKSGGAHFSAATAPSTSSSSSSTSVPLTTVPTAPAANTRSRTGGSKASAKTAAAPGISGKKTRRTRATASSPPMGRRGKEDAAGGGQGVPDYATVEKTLQPLDDGPCPICMCQLSEESGYSEEGSGGAESYRGVPYAPPVDLCKLRKCGHMMHRPCLLMMLKSDTAKNGLVCPTCKKVYGIRTGDMPNGTMTVNCSRGTLPGHEDNGTIQITYNFSPGVHNGRNYRANGFPRTCYLPDSEKGQKVLRLLKVAWERRLTFTIGTSVTTGATDTVVWNEIHHKTESTSNYSGHGYPDPNYLDNVLMELSLQGVTDSDSESNSDESL